jgi:deoxyribodipyrimidine photo-lyase
MARRTRHNLALEHALATAHALGRPLVVLEALRAGYPWASARLHRFALDGMADDAAAYARAGVPHLAYVRARARGRHRGCSRRSPGAPAWW